MARWPPGRECKRKCSSLTGLPRKYSISIFKTKAESKFLCVAAASIIARYLFLQEIEKLGKDN
ncbi:MAG: hypothetical protein Q8755_02745, partial [Candidatus Phytoplasma australasiaticum]|nr:hypothetical protein [Candidatus Phytoplasma australasiaticum]